ncbi:MAG: T9SS type A sorting domain-containing protein [Bacteroidetes bacterium]|nr:T9SS type A sorting domain-containing protein [Bacteroidota bacterium]
MRPLQIIFLCLFLHSFLFSQVDSSAESFFPHHVGNLWQYRFPIGALAWTEKIDSVFVDTVGTIFIRFIYTNHDVNYSTHLWYIIKDSNLVYRDLLPRIPQNDGPLYKLDAKLGETWQTIIDPYPIAKINAIDSISIFGHLVNYKEIFYGWANSSDSIWWNKRTIAEGFGLIRAELEPMPEVYLSGAIINNVQYGFLVSVPYQKILPEDFILHQNYPNPFNPSTTISYQLPEKNFVNLRVFDMLGREVALLVNEEKEKGSHQIRFTPTHLSSGVYLVRLTAGNFSQTTKIIYSK